MGCKGEDREEEELLYTLLVVVGVERPGVDGKLESDELRLVRILLIRDGR